MSESINYQSILIISILAFTTPILIASFKRVKIPYVVGEILVGLIVGKSFLNLVHDDSWVLFLSNLGLAYLMFISGLEIDFSQFKTKAGFNKNKKKLSLSVVMFLVSLPISFGISLILFKFHYIHNVLFFTFLLPATAPGLLVPMFKQRGLLDSDFGQTLLIFSLICEFICLIAITLISSVMSGGISYKSFLFIVVIIAAALLYFFGKWIKNRRRFSIGNFRGLHMEVRASFAVTIILVAVSHAVGVEIAFGSFIAGIVFSVISGHSREDLIDKVDIIGYGFLVPTFFIEVGVNIDIKNIFQNPTLLLLIPVILFIFFIVKFIPSLLLTRSFGLKKAVSSSFILSTQLSLMIVGLNIAQSFAIIDDASFSVFVFSIILSCLLLPVLFEKTFRYEGLAQQQPNALDKICIRETIVTNETTCDKPLKDLKFPPNCRIIMIIRGGEEVIPTGESVLNLGDTLLIAGVKANEDEVMDLILSDFEHQ